MPLLDHGNFGTKFVAVPRMAEIFRAQLAGAVGLKGNLNQSVKFADQILRDAIEGKPLESAMPCIRIAWTNQSLLIPGSGGVLNSTVTLHLFFLYSYGKPSTSILPMEFMSLREQHIQWNLEYLKNIYVGPNTTIGFTTEQQKDDSGKRFWWYPPDGAGQEAPLQHETPFDIFNVTVPMSPGFACSRLDLQVSVLNHCTFGVINTPDIMIYTGYVAGLTAGLFALNATGNGSYSSAFGSGNGYNTIVPVAGTFSNFRFLSSEISDGTDVLTIYKNGVATALTLTIPSGQSGAATSGQSFTCVAGDELNFVYVAGTDLSLGEWAVEFIPS
jgi:hypothetical protein